MIETISNQQNTVHFKCEQILQGIQQIEEQKDEEVNPTNVDIVKFPKKKKSWSEQQNLPFNELDTKKQKSNKLSGQLNVEDFTSKEGEDEETSQN